MSEKEFILPVPGVTVHMVETVPFINVTGFDTVSAIAPPRIDEDAAVNDSASVFVGKNCQASQEEFALQVDEVGSFLVRDGREVLFSVVPGADPEWVRLYLNGQVLVALLHQRKKISFHASSFVYDGQGVMILGETGAGKSSVTLAFALHDRSASVTGVAGNRKSGSGIFKPAGFLTDDLTPVVFEGPVPCIMPLNRKVKIRHDTAEELGIDMESLTEAERGTGKKYLSLAPVQMKPFPLGVIVKIETGPVDEPSFHTPSPAERFSLLRSEVCSWEILAGMPETETEYLKQLVQIVEKTEFVRVVRPVDIRVIEFYNVMRDAIPKLIAGRIKKS